MATKLDWTNLDNEEAKLKAQSDTNWTEYQAALSENTALKQQITTLTGQVNTLTTNVATLTSSVSSLQTENAALKKEIEILKGGSANTPNPTPTPVTWNKLNNGTTTSFSGLSGSFKVQCDPQEPVLVHPTVAKTWDFNITADSTWEPTDVGKSPPCNRSEFEHTSRWAKNVPVWVHYLMKIDGTIDMNKDQGIWCITQWHSYPSKLSGPVANIGVSQNTLTAGVRGDDDVWNSLGNIPFTSDFYGRWIPVVQKLTFGQGTGAYSIWFDKKPFIAKTGLKVGSSGNDAYFKMGVYRRKSNNVTSVKYHGLMIGTADLSAYINTPIPAPAV